VLKRTPAASLEMRAGGRLAARSVLEAFEDIAIEPATPPGRQAHPDTFARKRIRHVDGQPIEPGDAASATAQIGDQEVRDRGGGRAQYPP